jgi:beta-1,4-mannooligosaccharide/beta-1,4-mannosyl-N-acetylglucosamine phosphorylase
MARKIVRRFAENPVLSPDRVPEPCTQVFNAGVAFWKGRYVMVFRADTWSHERQAEVGTFLGLAESDDGARWTVTKAPLLRMGHRTDPSVEVKRAYDPRLTVLDGRLYMCFAQDTLHGVRAGLAVTDDADLSNFEILSLSLPENRNCVLLPERIDGKLARLDRPFPIYSKGGGEAFDMWFSDSPDGKYWGNVHLVLGAEQVPYCNSKIGPGAPPIRTERGWLGLFHAVVKDESRPLGGWEPQGWKKVYHAGLVLLDAEEPWKVLGISPEPVLSPDPAQRCEMEGFRGSVIFPGGMLLDEDGATVRIYYGAADTTECLATADLGDLLATIEPIV